MPRSVKLGASGQEYPEDSVVLIRPRRIKQDGGDFFCEALQLVNNDQTVMALGYRSTGDALEMYARELSTVEVGEPGFALIAAMLRTLMDRKG